MKAYSIRMMWIIMLTLFGEEGTDWESFPSKEDQEDFPEFIKQYANCN
jgi:hypothetical protein